MKNTLTLTSITMFLFGTIMGVAMYADIVRSQPQATDYPDYDLKLMIETPQSESTHANIGSIRGWAVHPSAQVLYVDIFVDGEFTFSVPVGGGRGDVYNAYPDYYQSRFSGWNQTVNFKNMTDGPHTVEVIAYTEFGGYASKTVDFCVTRFISEFISDPEEIKLWETKRYHVWHDRMVLEGVMIEGRRWNMELSWSTASQSFEITQTTVYRLIDEYTTYECDTEG